MKSNSPRPSSVGWQFPWLCRAFQRSGCVLGMTCTFTSMTGCQASTTCDGNVELGRLTVPGAAPILLKDVHELQARAATEGTTMNEEVALRDLLWQEKERIRLGLPGGQSAAQSRRRAVSQHARRLLDGKASALGIASRSLPPEAQLTTCGRALTPGSQ